MQVVLIAAKTLTLEEVKKCSQLDRKIGFMSKWQIKLHEVPSGVAMYRRHSSDLLERNQPYKDKASDGAMAVIWRKHDVELKEKLLDKIIPNDRENCNNWLGNGNSGMDAVAQANPNVFTQRSSGHGKQLEKRAWKFEHSSYLMDEMDEGVQLNQDDILETTITTDEFADEISLM